MHTVMMYGAIRRNVKCTGVTFGVNGIVHHVRYFADGYWDTVTNVMLDWTRDGKLSADLYTGEIA
jgi:hypothetical protein